MARTAIEWTDYTFNPWAGCVKVSDGCRHCYAESFSKRFKTFGEWGVNGTRKRTSEVNWRKPLNWNKKAKEQGTRYKVFCASMADVLEDRPELESWRMDLLHLINQTRYLDWQILTKRPQNSHLLSGGFSDEEMFWFTESKHVWIGTSVEDERVLYRIDELRQVPTRGIRFLSCEPLLGPLNNLDLTGIHWVIVGGESGPNARQMHPDWVRSIRNQCVEQGVAFHFKQWGGRNKKKAGRVLDGRTWDQFPHQKG